MLPYQDDRNKNKSPLVDFHGATVINEAGEEIPITEQMIQYACRQLIHQWEQFHPHGTCKLLEGNN